MRDLFLKDLGWKLLSLFLALGIWLTVHKILTEVPVVVPTDGGGAPPASATTIIYPNQPVQIVSTVSDVHLFRAEPPEVKLTLIGSAERMATLEADHVRALVDLTDTNSTQQGFHPVVVSLPSGVTLVNVDPPAVIVLPPKP